MAAGRSYDGSKAKGGGNSADVADQYKQDSAVVERYCFDFVDIDNLRCVRSRGIKVAEFTLGLFLQSHE